MTVGDGVSTGSGYICPDCGYGYPSVEDHRMCTGGGTGTVVVRGHNCAYCGVWVIDGDSHLCEAREIGLYLSPTVAVNQLILDEIKELRKDIQELTEQLKR